MNAVRVAFVVLLVTLGFFLIENLGASQAAETGDDKSSMALSVLAEQTGRFISTQ